MMQNRFSQCFIDFSEVITNTLLNAIEQIIHRIVFFKLPDHKIIGPSEVHTPVEALRC